MLLGVSLGSLLGRTMSALMGDRPRTILPLLAKAYNVSVEGNEHQAELVGDSEVVWRCTVEPVEWYPDTFAGIIEGTMQTNKAASVRVATIEEQRTRTAGRYTFRITW